MQVCWNLDSDKTGPAWSWDVSWNLGEFEMVAAWIWDAILRTWMEVRRTSLILDELEMVPGWSWDAIYGPGWRWDVTKMEVKWKYKDVDWGEVLPGWGGEVNLWACMEVTRPGRGWDGTRTELKQISWDLGPFSMSLLRLSLLGICPLLARTELTASSPVFCLARRELGLSKLRASSKATKSCLRACSAVICNISTTIRNETREQILIV